MQIRYLPFAICLFFFVTVNEPAAGQFCPIVYNTPDGTSSSDPIVQSFTPLCSGILDHINFYALGNNFFTVRILSACNNGVVLGEANSGTQTGIMYVIKFTGVTLLAGTEYMIFIPASGNQFIINPFNTNPTGTLITSDCIPVPNLDLRYDLLFGALLPVKLSSFNASYTINGVQLIWTAQQEENLIQYNIERSYDAVNFSIIAQMPATGSNNIHQYKYTDTTRNATIVFYRLKMINNNSHFSYSPIVKLNLPKPSDQLTVNTAPNPFREMITINCSSPFTQQSQVKILSLDGQILKTKTVLLQKGNTMFQWNGLENLASGVYLLQLWSCSKVCLMKKIIKA